MRTLIATLAVLGVAAQTAQAQSNLRINEPARPAEPLLVAQPLSGAVVLSIEEVISVVDTVAETRVATFRLTGGATVAVTFWYPAMQPAFSFRGFLPPLPGALMTRALRSVKDNPGSYTRPFSLRVWRERFGTASYSAYSGTDLQLRVPMPVRYNGNSYSGGLYEVRISAAGFTVNGYATWGYLTLESDSGTRRPFNILRAPHAASGISPMDVANGEDLCDDVFVSPLWVALVGVHKDMVTDDRFIHSGTGWWK